MPSKSGPSATNSSKAVPAVVSRPPITARSREDWDGWGFGASVVKGRVAVASTSSASTNWRLARMSCRRRCHIELYGFRIRRVMSRVRQPAPAHTPRGPPPFPRGRGQSPAPCCSPVRRLGYLGMGIGLLWLSRARVERGSAGRPAARFFRRIGAWVRLCSACSALQQAWFRQASSWDHLSWPR